MRVGTIPLGRQSALRQEAALRTLSLDEADWQAYVDQRTERRMPARRTASAAHRYQPSSPTSIRAPVQALMDNREGKPVDAAQLKQDIARLYATDDFQQIRTHIVGESDGSTALVVQPVEKEWGPNYVNLDLDLSTDLQGNSRFNARAATRSTWLDRAGLEWRNSFSSRRH